MSKRLVLLRVLLLILAADALIGSAVIFLGGREAIIRFIPSEAQSQVTDLYLLFRVETAGLRFGLGVMWLLALREPHRNPAVIVGSAVTLFALATAELVAPYLLHVKQPYSSTILSTHALVRIVFAVVLLACHAPHHEPNAPAA